MDSPEEYSAIESVEENSLEIEGVHLDNDVRGNGYCGNLNVVASPCDVLGEGGEIGLPGESPPSTAQCVDRSTPPMTKGYGLKKWRRIRRDVVKEVHMSLDASKVLKRGFYGAMNGAKPSLAPLEVGNDNEASVGSMSSVRDLSNVGVDVFASPFGLDINFAAEADSDNSKDESSKLSTAASAPKTRHVSPAALGYARDRIRVKNLSGKGVGQSGKAHVESSKKQREERVKIQKENSHSSVESHLRSSNAFFMQGAFSTAGNGMRSGKSTTYYHSGNSDDPHQSGQFSEDGSADYPKEIHNVDSISQDGSAAWEAEEEKDGHHPSSAERDPLDQSLQALKSVQEALEKEVEKFCEIAKEPVVLIDEKQISNPMDYMRYLEVALEEARMTLRARESRIYELEASLSNPKSPKEESASNSDLLTNIPMDELESAFKQRIEAEIEYLSIVRTIQKLSVDIQSQLLLLTEQEAAREPKTVLDRLTETETRAAMLGKRAEELEKASEDIIEAEEVLKLQKITCKAATWLFLQLLLLILVVWFLVSRLMPLDNIVIPT
ncbi:hypothetical protein MLD38_022129 [Melastoma candidum]|uniref:Uncharacterized protein n=1 Tax=Melastoma candidum TaxID=119954 RepID=A0ACB9QM57_9MYRT|nr:hypothetical protein MLD38_022129 [Melastoma candidum]